MFLFWEFKFFCLDSFVVYASDIFVTVNKFWRRSKAIFAVFYMVYFDYTFLLSIFYRSVGGGVMHLGFFLWIFMVEHLSRV